MTRTTLRAAALAAALLAGAAFAAGAAKPAKDPADLRAVLTAWQGKPVTLNWYDKEDKKSRRTLVAVGSDYLRLDSDEFDAVYIPMARVARIEVKGDKLIVVLNTGG